MSFSLLIMDDAKALPDLLAKAIRAAGFKVQTVESLTGLYSPVRTREVDFVLWNVRKTYSPLFSVKEILAKMDIPLVSEKSGTLSSLTPTVQYGPFRLEPALREVTIKGTRIQTLTESEFNILEQLVRARGRILPIKTLFRALHKARAANKRPAGPADLIYKHISDLRKKLGKSGRLIQLRRRVGYGLKVGP